MIGKTPNFEWVGLDRPPIPNMKNSDKILASVITEKPYLIEVEGKYIAFPPMTLGQSLLVAEVAEELGIDTRATLLSPTAEMLRIVAEKRDSVCRYLALRSFHAKNKLLNEREIEERMRLFKDVENEELATLLLVLLTDSDRAQRLIKELGIDEEQERMAKALKAKKDGGSLNFGGRSIYGQLIDRACERYGWEMEYVVWGISYANLTLLLADQQTSVYLTDEERRNARLPRSGEEVLNGDDPNNQQRLKELLRG